MGRRPNKRLNKNIKNARRKGFGHDDIAHERSCYRSDGLPKKHFLRGTAKAKAKEIRRESGRIVKVYKCPSCGAWHIGNDTRRNREQKRA